jgi:fibronectin-binding autotransporter adhesin
MKSRYVSPLTILAASAACFVWTSASSNAAALTWDTVSGDGTTVTAGSGNWNLTAGNTVWNNAGSNGPWSQTSTTDGSNSAIFGGTDGTLNQYVVTLGAQMAAEAVTFNSSGYQITGSTLALIVSPTAPISNGAITVAGGKTATINSILRYAHNNPASVIVGSGGTLNLGGGTTASNNPQWQLSGAGTLNLNAGTFTNNIGNFNTSAINLTGGTHAITPGNDGGANIGNNAGQSVNYTISGTGTLTVNGNASTATVLNSHLALGRASGNTAYQNTLTVQSGATVNIGTTASRAGELRIASDATSNGKLDVQGGSVTIGTGDAANKIYLFKGGSGSGYTATMTQSGGTVTANGIQFGGSTGTYDAASSASLQLSGGSLFIGAAGMTQGSAASALPVTIQLQGGALGASADWSTSLDIKLASATIQAANGGASSRNITLSGLISNDGAANGAFTKTGGGTLFLSHESNTFSGQVLSDSGVLQVTKLANAGTASSLGTGASANVVRLGNNATATLEYVGTTDSSTNRPLQIGTNNATNTGSAEILNNSASGSLTFNAATFNTVVSGVTVARTLTLGGGNTMDNAISGQIANNGGVGGTISVVKQDAGKWILNGSNSYTGETSVTAGTLVVNGNISTSSLTTVSSGAILGGSGTVGSLTILDGGFLEPGNSPGTLNTGTLSLAEASVLGFELNPADTTIGSNINDLISVTGNFNLNGILNVVATSGDFLSVTAGATWRLFDYSGTLTNDELTLGSMPSLNGGLVWQIDTGTTGQVNLVAIPEPGAVLLGGLGFLVLLRRRRH